MPRVDMEQDSRRRLKSMLREPDEDPRSNQNYMPRDPPAFALDRDRLVSLLALLARQRLTLVVAPPGYGKTVLLSQWASHATHRVRWLALVREDNEPGRLALDLCQALDYASRPFAHRVFGLLEPRGHEMGPTFMAALVDELERMPPTTLVLDDFHLLSNPVLLDELATIIDHAPRFLHVLVATRVDPPLQYYQLRLWESPLRELRQEDLAFTPGEAAALLERLAQRKLTKSQIVALVTRTEGWPAGLQLAALSLQDSTDPENFVEKFVNDDRHVADYLTEHVLRHQPEPTRRFLLATSVLDALSGPLCDFVISGHGGQAMLEHLDRKSVFITRLDRRRSWFRYHHLFRALLRHHLRDENPATEAVLLRRAGQWHLARGDPETGVRYLQDGGAWEELLQVAFTHGGSLFTSGRSSVVARWIELVPRAVRQRRPDVLLLEAAALTFGGDGAAAGKLLDDLERLASAASVDRAVTELLRAWCALQRGAAAQAVAAADRALNVREAVGWDSPTNVLGLTGRADDVAVAARLARGIGLLHEGKFSDARFSLEAVLEECHVIWQVVALGSLALIEAWSGRLTAGERLGLRALSVARQLEIDQQPILVEAYLALTHIALERSELDRARGLLREAMTRSTPWHALVAASIAIEEALLALAGGQPVTGLAAVTARRARGEPPLPPAALARKRAVQAQLLTMVGELDRAQEVLDLEPGYDSSDLASARVRLAVSQGALHTAQVIIERWPAGPEPRACLERSLWLAIVDHIDGDESRARDRFAAVITAAGSEEDLGVFRAAGCHVLGVARALYRTAPTAFLRRVIEQTSCARPLRPATDLIEQVTEREYVVLTLLPTRLSNLEIAEHMGVSLNTVKTHLKHIYRKLGVTGRCEAVMVAERLHLL